MTRLHFARAPLYTEFRGDGWPFCPRCGEDELWSDSVPAHIDSIVCCYRCGWEPTPESGKQGGGDAE